MGNLSGRMPTRGNPLKIPEIVHISGEDNFAFQSDSTTTASVTYIGLAPIGSVTSHPVWQIQKVDTSSGVVIKWADGNDKFDNIWDNRASLSYS